MKLEQPIKYLQIAPASDELLNYDFCSIDWSLSTDHQMKYIEHRDTLTFKFLSCEFKLSSSVFTYNTDHELYPIIMQEVRKLEEHYNATAKIAVLAGIKPKGSIPLHCDPGDLFRNAHRVHLALDTGPEAVFTIDTNRYYFEKGKWLEIDNTRMHGFYNGLDKIRVHLIIDLVPNIIYDPRTYYNGLLPKVVLGN